MPSVRLSMRKIKEILRLKWALALSHRQVAASCRVGPSTVADYLLRARSAGLSWVQVQELDEASLEQRLFPSSSVAETPEKPVPDWKEIHQDLSRKGVTLALLWQEYQGKYPEGYQYSRFCDLYRAWAKTLTVSMRQDHKAGEKLFVDYSGMMMEIVDGSTGEIRPAEIFVATLGASNYTYAEATWSQGLEDWIASHIRALEYFGGSTELVIPDNLKSGVDKACRYEPDLNQTYSDFANHYGVAVIPARSRKPKDKAKVENGVQQIQRWVLAPLRNHTFFSLGELNEEIRKLLVKLNERPLRQLGVSRRELYERLDRPALQALPATRYECAEFKKVRLGPDYHVEIDEHYYSVPYTLIRQELEARVSRSTVEIRRCGKVVAAHLRSFAKGGHTTVAEHMPEAHRAYAEWTPKRLVRWARETGEATAELVETIMSTRAHPQQGFRPCLGIMRLGKKYGNDRLEAACRRALGIGGLSYKSVKSILESGLDRQEWLPEPVAVVQVEHENIRGASYYEEVVPC